MDERMNKVISYEKWREVVFENQNPMILGYSVLDFPFCRALYYQGKRVFFDEKHVVIFERCSFCGTENQPEEGLYGGFYCSCCGAPILL